MWGKVQPALVKPIDSAVCRVAPTNHPLTQPVFFHKRRDDSGLALMSHEREGERRAEQDPDGHGPQDSRITSRNVAIPRRTASAVSAANTRVFGYAKSHCSKERRTARSRHEP